ncbi:MAG: DUF4401 domain-containing protein, partial [Candidatus Thiodiazotropha sp.]
MNRPSITLAQVLDGLRAEQLTQAGDDALAYLDRRPAPQPWYVRAMVGFGAWLASLMLIGFVTSLSMIAGGGYGIIGALLITGATLIRQRADGDFLTQCAMAASLAGQALLAYAVADSLGYDETEAFLGVALMMSVTLFFIYPDSVHRVLMLLLAAGELTGLLYHWEANALVPLIGPLLAGALILLMERLPTLAGSRHARLIQPLASGLMLGAFGLLLLSTVYLLPELGAEFVFYPRPWISSLLLGAALLYLGNRLWPELADPADARSRRLFLALLLLIAASAWYAPGLNLGLIVLLLGARSGRRSFIGAGI